MVPFSMTLDQGHDNIRRWICRLINGRPPTRYTYL